MRESRSWRERKRKKEALRKSTATVLRRAKPKALGWLSQSSGFRDACRVFSRTALSARARRHLASRSRPHAPLAERNILAPRPRRSTPRRADQLGRFRLCSSVSSSRGTLSLPFDSPHSSTLSSSLSLPSPRPSPLSFCFTSKTPVLHIYFFRICDDRANFRPMHGHASANSRDHDR